MLERVDVNINILRPKWKYSIWIFGRDDEKAQRRQHWAGKKISYGRFSIEISIMDSIVLFTLNLYGSIGSKRLEQWTEMIFNNTHRQWTNKQFHISSDQATGFILYALF